MPLILPQGMDANLSRRRLLQGGGALWLASLAGLSTQARASTDLQGALVAQGAVAADKPGKRLSFLHTHTGERLSVCYFEKGGYVPEGLARVRHLCRDFRNGQAHDIDAGLLDILHDLQVLADREGAYEIISAYRSPATNAQLRKRSTGVAEKSLHLTGRAMDVRLPGFSTRRLAELARGLQRGGVGYYAGSDFVHVDTGRVRYW